MYLRGQDSAEIKKKLNLGSTTTTLPAVGGVGLLLVVVAAAVVPPEIDFGE